MTEINQWLKKIAEDETYWSFERKEDFPSPLVYEYLYLRELAHQVQLYGVILQSRDLFETLIKFPCVMGLIIVINQDELRGTPVFKDLIRRSLKDPMSMGSWYELAGKMVQKNKELCLPASLVRVLRETRSVFSKKITDEYPNIINWRNKTIGHGALRFQEDPQYQEEIRSIFDLLKTFFSVDHGYRNVYIRCGNLKMIGERTLLDDGCEVPELVLEGEVYPVSNYMLIHDLKCFFFNSFYRERNIIRYSSYMVGQEYTKKDHYFGPLFQQYVVKESVHEKALNSVVTRRNEKVLECLTQPDRYIIPEGIVRRLQTEMNTLGRGVIAIHMERGTGKTALAGRMNGLYHRDSLIGDCFGRTYHLSRMAIRGNSDFVNSVNSSFMYGKESDNDIWSHESELPALHMDADDRAEQMADFLNGYHDIRGCEYTVLILDGIDETDGSAGFVMDFIPSRESLEKGVFVLLLSRMVKEKTVTDQSRRMIEIADEKADRILTFERTDPAFIQVMKEYIGNDICFTEDAEELIRKADYRFLYLKPYAAVKDDSVLDSQDESVFVKSYFNHLLSIYGPAQRKLLKEISAVIAMFPGISLSEYRQHLNLYELTYSLIGTLNDLMPLLTVTRRDGENRYEFADVEYREYVLENCTDEIYAAAEIFEQSVKDFCEWKYDFIIHGFDRDEGFEIQDRKDVYFFGRNCISLWKLSNRFATEGKKELVSEWVIDLWQRMEEDKWLQGGYGSWLMDGLTDCAMETLWDGIHREAEGKNCGIMADSLLEEQYGGVNFSFRFSSRIEGSELRQFALEHLAQFREPEWFFWLFAEDFDESDLPYIRQSGAINEFVDYLVVFPGNTDQLSLMEQEDISDEVREKILEKKSRYSSSIQKHQKDPRALIKETSDEICSMVIETDDELFFGKSDWKFVHSLVEKEFRSEDYEDDLKDLYRKYYERLCREKEEGHLSKFISHTGIFRDLHVELMKSIFGENGDTWINALLKTADEIWNSSAYPSIWHKEMMQKILIHVTEEYLNRNQPDKAAETAEKLILKYDMPIFIDDSRMWSRYLKESGRTDLVYCTDNALAMLQLRAAYGLNAEQMNRKLMHSVDTIDHSSAFKDWLPEVRDIQKYRFLRLQKELGFAETIEDAVQKIVGDYRQWIKDFLNTLSLESSVSMLIYHIEILLEYYKQMLMWKEGRVCCDVLKEQIMVSQNAHDNLPAGFLTDAIEFIEKCIARFEMKMSGQEEEESYYHFRMKDFVTGWSEEDLSICFKEYPDSYSRKYNRI